MISRALASVFGAVLMIYGLIAAFSPLPFGAPLVILGLLVIAAANPAARPLLRRMRRRWPWFDSFVRHVGKRAAGRFSDVLDETEPARNDAGQEENATSSGSEGHS